MVWAPQCQTSYQLRCVPLDTFREDELERFQKFVIEDYIIGNLDRHRDNWLWQEDEGHLAGIIAIDNANAFLERNPADQLFMRIAG